jgi:Fe2+ or Zn2+ uptake regulation protein
MTRKAIPEAQLDIFYNTTHLAYAELKKRKQVAGRQSSQILSFFSDNPEGFFTPFEVWQYANMKGAPITSIRRAIHTLTHAGYLVKTDQMKEGEYGTANHTWKYVKPY